MEPFKPDIEELNHFVVAGLVTAAALTAYHHSVELISVGSYLLIGFLVILARELGQRTIAQWMRGDTELHLSVKGSIVTIIGAIIAVITQLPVILLFPVYNSYSMKGYENWEKSINAMWIKREMQIITGGLIALFLGWFISLQLGYTAAAQAFALFALFQLLPFDYPSIPTGKLDGATILRFNSFRWLVFFALALIALALV